MPPGFYGSFRINGLREIMLVNTAITVHPWTGPEGFQYVEANRFQYNRHMKVVRLSALRTGRLYATRKYSWYSFLL
jgi:hypothetical protein